jgi:hypothetical protein
VAEPVFILGKDDASASFAFFTLNGVTYRVPAIDSSGRLIVKGIGSGGAVEVIQDTPDDLRVGVYGRYSGAWQRQPLQFGFSAQYNEQQGTVNAAAGTNTLTTAAVPANTLRVVTSVLAYNVNTVAGIIILRTTIGAVSRSLRRAAPGAANRSVDWQGLVYLLAGDTVSTDITGCALNDDIFLDVHGYDMTLNL